VAVVVVAMNVLGSISVIVTDVADDMDPAVLVDIGTVMDQGQDGLRGQRPIQPQGGMAFTARGPPTTESAIAST